MPSLSRILAFLASLGAAALFGAFALFIGSPVSVPETEEEPDNLAFVDDETEDLELGDPVSDEAETDDSTPDSETSEDGPAAPAPSSSTTTTVGDSNPFGFSTTSTTETPDITLPSQILVPPTTDASQRPTTSSTTSTTASTTSSSSTTTTEATTSTTGSTTTSTTTTTVPTTPPPNERTLVFEENFNSLSPSRWKTEHSTYGDGNNELQCYTPQQVSVANGSLVLTAEKRTETCPNGSTRDVTSGMVRSNGLTFSPGQSIEWRVKLTPTDSANQAGLWPAFWSSGWAGGGWPNGGEWDGFEVMTARNPKRSVFSIHYAKPDGSHGKTGKEVVAGANFSDSWHTFRFDYGTDGVLVWFMDGTEVQRVTNAPTAQGWPAPFDQAMTELKINLALGGNPGALDERALPATYQVDYIRIYDMPS